MCLRMEGNGTKEQKEEEGNTDMDYSGEGLG
jgi:hypothetical protein